MKALSYPLSQALTLSIFLSLSFHECEALTVTPKCTLTPTVAPTPTMILILTSSSSLAYISFTLPVHQCKHPPSNFQKLLCNLRQESKVFRNIVPTVLPSISPPEPQLVEIT